MDFNTDWDIEQYRTKFECEEHWALKRDFMLAHKDSFPEERLVCLAQLFVNIELLRCMYPKKVMHQVSILAKEIGHDYKDRQKKRLQRTFVGASAAASAKARGEEKSYAQGNKEIVATKSLKPLPKPKTWMPEKESIESSQIYFTSSISGQACINKYNSLPASENHSKVKMSPIITATRQKTTSPLQLKVPETVQSLLENNNLLSKIVLFIRFYPKKRNYTHIIKQSVKYSGMTLKQEYQGTLPDLVCYLFIDNRILLGIGFGNKRKEAEKNASKNALERLLKICYCCKVLKISSDNAVSLDELEVITPINDDQERLSHNNVGAQLMKQMGWSGGALGKFGEGITEPIKGSTTVGRRRLGLGNGERINQNFIENVTRLLHNFMLKKDLSDLVFSSDLTKIQTKEIRRLVYKIGRKQLKSCSLGKSEKRLLVVSWKSCPADADFIQTILDQGGKTNKYELLKPNTITINDL